MGIWGFEAAIDSSYPVALAGPSAGGVVDSLLFIAGF
jgi:hypothetical protein